MKASMKDWIPALEWLSTYTKDIFVSDAVAAVIVTIMLIPQSLAYAMLAGLPPEVGLYASVAPLVLYAIFGSSRVLAVGPVAVVSLMTAAAAGQIAAAGSEHYLAVALTLAFLSGVFLLILGVLKLGFLANFLSHPVISGFISASGILIACSQLKTMMGVQASGHNLVELLGSILAHISDLQWLTLLVGVCSAAFLFWVRKGLKPFLMARGLPNRLADILAKAGPVAAIVVTSLASWLFDFEGYGMKIVGHIPQGLPPLTLPMFAWDEVKVLLMPALLLSIVGFVESVSVGQTLAAKRRQRIRPDQELVALGAANVSASLTGGYPVTGGFARSVVNFDAGAQTPAAGVMTAAGLLLASLLLTPALYYLPQATLAATIIVAVLSLVDLSVLKRTWRYNKPDFLAVAATLLLTLGVGVEAGLVAGVGVSIVLFLLRTSRPHVAEVGLVFGTEHFRNIKRHSVATEETLVSLRVDESLYFANARFLEDLINEVVAKNPKLKHVVLQCSAVNDIDASALESLEAIDQRLNDSDIQLHLSEIKGPVMDKLQRSQFAEHLSGEIFLSHFNAIEKLTPSVIK